MPYIADRAPAVLSVGTALPPHELDQRQAQAFAGALFGERYRDVERLLAVFDNGQVESRRVSADLDWYRRDHTWAEWNELYVATALELGEAAARRALARARLEPADLEAIVFVSTTGLATPSLDALLLKRLGMSRHAVRLPVWGLGCAGGAAGLSRAADLARARPGRRVLLVAVELCSLTFQRDDLSKSNLIAASLFADGAAAAVVGPGEGPAVLGSFSTLWDDTEDLMGWDVNDAGLRVRFSRDVPALVERVMRRNLSEAAASVGLALGQLRHLVTHPGGLKVLRAYEVALSLEPGALGDAHAVLRGHGNMSSASVLFVLERFLRRWPELAPGEFGAISAMGPGFSSEHVLFST